MPVRISLDRALPVPIGVQLKGQIEYGIVSGELRPGEQLPSVRELAARMEIAQLTVSLAYNALKRDGLIQVRPGMGTYVAPRGDSIAADANRADLHRLVETMIVGALERGFSSSEINRAVAVELVTTGARHPHIAIVGLFDHATRAYARDIADVLADRAPEVTPWTMAGLRADKDARVRVCTADVILTLPNRVKEVQRLLGPNHPPVQGLSFIVHPTTVARLHALSGDLHLGLVSTFAEFLPTMLQGVTACVQSRHTPLCTTLSDVERLSLVLAQADVIIYASGSDEVRAALAAHTQAIEYLHTPERSTVEDLRPLLADIHGVPFSTGAKRRWSAASAAR